MNVSLPNSRKKVDRAKHHFSELESEIQSYHARDPYRIVFDTETKPGEKLCRFEFLEPIPCNLGNIIGDIVHNLRTALDSLAVDLVRANGGVSKTAVRETYFPIGSSYQEFENAHRSKFARASDNAKRLVRRLKPYRGGCGPFWQIHQLDILDKHTSIVPVGVGGGKMGIRFQAPTIFLPHETPPEDYEPVELPIVWFNLAKCYPLKNGEVVARAPMPGGAVVIPGPPGTPQVDLPPPPDPDLQFTIVVAFGEGQIVDGEPVIPTLKQFIDFIDRVVDIFERYGP